MIELFKRVSKTPENVYGCQKAKSIPIDSPSIIIFGGDRTLSDKDANYYMSILQKTLPTDIDIFAIAYDIRNTTITKADAERRLIFERAKNNVIADPIETISQDVIDLFDIVITPRIADNNGKKIDIYQAIKNLQNLTIYTHCHGSVIAYHFQHLMKDKLKKLRYSKYQTDMIMQNLAVIQHAPVAPLTRNKFSTLSFLSALEPFARQYKVIPKWVLHNAEKLPVSYFPKKYGNFIIAHQISAQALVEHYIEGFEFRDLMTLDGQVLFNAEENAIQNSIHRTKVLTPAEIISGNNVNFDELKSNGIAFQKMVQTLKAKIHYERNQAHAYQK